MKESQITITTPPIFRCPISLDLFQDPVTLCTGQTYDRSSIEKWLSLGNLTCPVTMQKLHDLSIIPNHTLRHLIHQWLLQIHQFDPFSASLSSLKHTLQSNESTLHNKLQALEEINALSDEYCFFNKSCFLQLGFLPLLLEQVLDSQNPISFTELALSCVVKLLPLGFLHPLDILKEESRFQKFLLLFEKGTISIKTSLCHVIDSSSSSSSSSEEVCSKLGSSQKLVNEILLLLHHQNCEASAIKAISALCSCESNMENLVRAGAIEEIIMKISGSERRKDENLGVLGMSIVEKLVGLNSGKEGLVKSPRSIKGLVKMVFSFKACDNSSEECSEIAVGLLLRMCEEEEDENGREEAIDGGIVTQLLLLLQSQCSNTTKAKARKLLKLITSKWV
ncbi:U-box domain-containing protein 25-like [Senna tora]|uniref:U-box domain-containing protein n=1 Tax=Senna tora TaxID=362788 RepID=A0A834X930_9FABA|nr:U-box domain-containing protein 25-like [Senna tora]